jgi:ribosome recycling factor
MPMNEVLQEIEDKMKKALEFLYQEFRSIRTGRASVGILDFVKVEYYGDKVPLNQVATLSTTDASTIVIDPWDKSSIRAIEKAIDASDLHLTPSNDGIVIRLNLPPLTQERRLDILKIAKKKSEETKVAIRNVRREGNEKIKKIEKEKLISEDEGKRMLDKVQNLTDHYIAKTEETLKHKEEEILEV